MPTYSQPDNDGRIRDNFYPDEYRFRTPTELQTAIHFNEEKKLDKLRQYVTGMPWEVDFFTQNGDYNSITQDPDLVQHITSNTYTRINKLVIYVTSPIDMTQPENLECTATINADFLVKVGDCFVATLIGGRIGLFVVQESDQEHYNLHQCFVAKFKLFGFINAQHQLYNNLLAKVTKTYIYNKGYGVDGTTQLLTTEEYALKDDIENAIEDIVDYYFRTFIDPESKFLQLPNSNMSLHYVDQELGKFVRSVYSVMDYPMIVNLQTIDYKMDKTVRYTVWDALRERNAKLIARAEPFIGWKPSPYTSANLNSLSARYLDVDYIVDKVTTPVTMSGIEDTKVDYNKDLSKYPKLKQIQEERYKAEQKHVQEDWEPSLPGIDFNITPREVAKEEDPVALVEINQGRLGDVDDPGIDPNDPNNNYPWDQDGDVGETEQPKENDDIKYPEDEEYPWDNSGDTEGLETDGKTDSNSPTPPTPPVIPGEKIEIQIEGVNYGISTEPKEPPKEEKKVLMVDRLGVQAVKASKQYSIFKKITLDPNDPKIKGPGGK